jgi:hypothetical protein
MDKTLILKKHAPLLFFDSREEFFPSTIEYYQSNIDIVSSEGNVITDTNEEIDFNTLPTGCSIQYRNSECQYGFRDLQDFTKVPYYACVIDDKQNHAYELIYFVFFPAQEQTYLCGCIPLWKPHSATIKSIRLIIDKDSQDIRKIFLDEEESNLYEMEKFNKNVIIYCNLYNHQLSLEPQSSLCDYHDCKGRMICPKFIESIDLDTLAKLIIKK